MHASQASPEGLEQSDQALESNAKSNGSLRRHKTLVSRAAIPGAFVQEGGSHTSTASEDSPNSRSTTPLRHSLSRHNSGLPPTPPTLTNSDIAEPEQERASSPTPLFADRVRNALEVQKPRLSTPIMETNSPPTPDPSPPTHRVDENLPVPRPPLEHQSSSYADSFKTATEGRSAHGSTSEVHLLPSDFDNTPRQSWIDTNRSMGLANSRLTVVPVEPLNNDADSDLGETRIKNYHVESDGSDVEKKTGYSAEGEHTADCAPSSPTLDQTFSHRQAFPRLRKPIQPGDDLRRPDDYLMYGSLGSIKKWKRPERMSKTPPPREMDTEFLRNAQPVLSSRSRDMTISNATKVSIDVPPKLQTSNEPLTALPPIPPEERQVLTPQQKMQPLPEFAPSQPSKDTPSPPSTAQKEKSLEDNNTVYRMIQEENAKRHSAISDVGSVRVRVVSMPEYTRKLRHTPKRDSLRDDISMIGSNDSTHKLRHKRGMNSLGSEPILATEDAGEEDLSPNMSARNSKFAPAGSSCTSSFSARSLGNPHKLRRSIRALSLDRTRSVSDSVTHRHSVFPSATIDRPSPSPKLRRSSAEHRLETDNTVRRTSLSRDAPTTFPTGVKLETITQELTRGIIDDDSEKRERTSMAKREPTRDQRESVDMSFKSAQSPQRRSLDYRRLHSSATPMSTSQFSGTFESEADICEAQGVALYPHNNESLLIVQGTKIAKQTEQLRIINSNHESIDANSIPGINEPNFKAFVTEPDEIGKPLHSVESPLTNPRTAPEPPVIQFIPPTPNDELERQLAVPAEQQRGDAESDVHRRPSIKQRMRRYSETLVQPFPFGRSNSYRKSAPVRRTQARVSTRPTHLSSFWQPRDFWEDYSSDEEDNDDYEPLPAGGDTSEIADNEQKRHGAFFPRAMSKRMPGFRGTGGFLMGNSLGIDRHGTNVRRHHIDRKSSEEILRRMAERKRRRTFTLPFSGGTRFEYVGFAAFSAKVKDAKRRRQEQNLEKRREKLRESIGTRVYHERKGAVQVGQ